MNNILDTSGLSFDGDFDSQVEEILKYIRMSKEDIEHLQILFDEVQNIFESRWPGSHIEVFGSIVTGLALKNSDVDILCHLRPWFNQPRAIFVSVASKILKTYRHNFRYITPITKAKVPIVKFFHVPTQRHCDISFSGPLGVYNSELLEYYMTSDKRILPLAIIIKYWSKVHLLTGQNLMSNYCLTLLLIFYLQQKNIVCPFMNLQQNDETRLADDWNTAFTKVSWTCNTDENVHSLLGNFFKYYSQLKFDKFVISLYTGRLIEREKFVDLQNVPKEFDLYSDNVRRRACKELCVTTSMCVQDPMSHNRNCAIAVHPKLAVRIIDHLKKAADIYEKEPSYNFLKKILHTEEPPILVNKPIFGNNNSKHHGVQKHRPKRNRNMKQNARRFISC